MHDVIWVSIIAAVGSILAAWMSHRTHKAVNSRLDKLLQEIKKASFAEGVKSETDKQK